VNYTQIVLLPTGAGTARHLDPAGIQQYGHPVRWLPDGKQVVFPGQLAGHESRCFVQSVDGGKPHPVTPEGVVACSVSPDGKWIAGKRLGHGPPLLYPVNGGDPRPIPGLEENENFAWTSDPNVMYVNKWREVPVKIYKLNLTTGQKQLFKEVNPLDVNGLCDMSHIMFSPDGRSYIYGYTRLLSDLYLVKGLQ
jgi:Tol biopolymer transport system component